MAGTRISKRRTDRRNVRGMSLVELIVVLAILAIIEQNQSNAVTIYQAAQTALQQLNKSMEGKNLIENEDFWVYRVTEYGKPYTINDNNLSPTINSGNKDKYISLYSSTVDGTIPNSSAHMIYVLTYYRTNTDDEQNKLVKELIQP